MDTAVRKATRLEYQPPKQKHLTSKPSRLSQLVPYGSHNPFLLRLSLSKALVSMTHQNPANIDEIMRLLEKRLRENSWIVRGQESSRLCVGWTRLNSHARLPFAFLTDCVQGAYHYAYAHAGWQR